VRDLLSTLVHEMAHQEQEEQGKPSRSGYHNKEWGTFMQQVGLQPSNTGKTGGKVTGQRVDSRKGSRSKHLSVLCQFGL
jgi:predicted SprT family Zn-dependent metalloprotease